MGMWIAKILNEIGSCAIAGEIDRPEFMLQFNYQS